MDSKLIEKMRGASMCSSSVAIKHVSKNGGKGEKNTKEKTLSENILICSR